jgi:predicted RNA binding protein YcfA (HicA-like mRNA interferase family)
MSLGIVWFEPSSAPAWYRDHQVGSHLTLRHSTKPGVKVVIPMHPSRPLKTKTLQRILREAAVSVDDLRDLL